MSCSEKEEYNSLVLKYTLIRMFPIKYDYDTFADFIVFDLKYIG